MSDLPPAYTPAPAETKDMYPSAPSDQQQQQPPAGPPEHKAITYYPPAGAQQQHPQQLVIASGANVIVQEAQPPESFVGHIIFSCFVCWCCAWPCGLIAFILAGT